MNGRGIIGTILFLLLICGRAIAGYPAFDQYALFDGASYISVPFSNSLNGALSQGGLIGMDAWIYPTSFAGTPTVIGNDQTAGYWLGLTPAGLVRFTTGGITRESNGAVPLNQWTHIAVTYNVNTSEMRFYINNLLDRSAGNVGAAIGVNQMDFRIGADRQGAVPSNYFNGRIDEARIWSSDIPFSAASGPLYKIPQQFASGRYGKYLVSAWRLNGDGADSVSANNGAPVGSIAYASGNPPPHLARICAVLMNTGPQTHDFFIVPHTPSLSLVANYTLECWVKLSGQAGGSTTYQTFLSKGSVGMNLLSYWLGVNKQNGRLRFIPNGNSATALESGGALPVNQWVHVAASFSWDGANGMARLYINGAPDGSANYSSIASQNQFPLLIGTGDQQLQPPASLPFNGSIDEVRIWNLVRAPAEIGNAYRMEIDGPAAGLEASYHFNGDVLDLSGQDNHGLNSNPASNDLYFNDANDLPAFPSLALTAPNGGENWITGTSHSVTWTSSGLASLRISLSRDGGAGWTETLADTVPASAGTFSWIATPPATAQARVKIETTTPTPYAAQSAADFRISEPQPHMALLPASLSFTVTAGSNPLPASVQVKNSSGGTLNWSVAATKPWILPSPANGTQDDFFSVDINSASFGPGIYNGSITVSGNADNSPLSIPVQLTVSNLPVYPISGRVLLDTAGLAGVTVQLGGDATDAVLTAADGRYSFSGRPNGNYTVSPSHPGYDFTPAMRNVTIAGAPASGVDFSASPKHAIAMLHYRRGWNMISLPVDPDTLSLFLLSPDVVSQAYRYSPDTGYIAEPLLRFGTGYWIKFAREDSTPVSGIPRKSFFLRLTASGGGWNLIGTASGALPFSSILQTPAGSIVSMYQFDSPAGYTLPPGDMLLPGRGYFVKTSADATIQIVSTFTGSWTELERAQKRPSLLPDILHPPPPPK